MRFRCFKWLRHHFISGSPPEPYICDSWPYPGLIARHLGVSDKTAAKAIAWMNRDYGGAAQISVDDREGADRGDLHLAPIQSL